MQRLPLGFMALLAALSFAAPVLGAPRLNDTGATRCVDASGAWSATCAGTGQDGASGRDVRLPGGSNGIAGFAFERICQSGEAAGTGGCPARPVPGPGRNEWGCTLDRVTGRLWEMKTDDGGAHDKDVVYTNFGFQTGSGIPDSSVLIASANTASMCGHSDWRLPTVIELHSLLNFGDASGPLIDADHFPHTASAAHWSATLFARDTTAYWTVNYGSGRNSTSPRSFPSALRLVRADPDGNGSRFKLAASGQEVIDRVAGVAWRRCPEGQAWDGSGCGGDALMLDWRGALVHAKAQGGGWRLPNVKELFSLHASGLFSCIDPFFFGVPFPWNSMWSSTPVAGSSVSAWVFDYGNCVSTGSLDAASGSAFRLVRTLN